MGSTVRYGTHKLSAVVRTRRRARRFRVHGNNVYAGTYVLRGTNSRRIYETKTNRDVLTIDAPLNER